MSETSVTKTTGISALSLLGILFVGLKLTGYIDWSWWWVTLPFWIGIPLVLGLMALGALIWLLIAVVDKIITNHKRKRRKNNGT